jgi:hypothetical protein
LLEEEKACEGEEDVGSPDAEGWGEFALSGESDADRGEEVVDEDQAESDDEACALASALGGEAEGDSYEHEDEAGGGEGEAIVELNLVAARGGARGASELPKLREGDGFVTSVEAGEVRASFLLAGLHGELGGGEGGDVVLAGVGGGDVVLAAVG